MKMFLRKIGFAQIREYRYPFSMLNLDHDLKRIYETGYFEGTTALRGKPIDQDQFLLWGKWNFIRGFSSYSALALFNGTKYENGGETSVIGTSFPAPLFIIGFYFGILLLTLSAINGIVKNTLFENYQMILFPGFMVLIFLSAALYFRRRIRKTVETELNLKTYRVI